MKKSIPLFAAVAVAAVASPAAAQSVGDAPFTGLRVEALAGYDQLRAGSSVDDDVNVDNDQSAEGVTYGGAVGYDVDLGAVVVGAEAELMGSSADTDYDNGDFEGFGYGNVSAGRDIYLGARVGAKVGPQALIYAKGGYTNAKLNVRSNDGTATFDDNYKLDGYRLGAGVEYAFNPRMYAKLEYRYSNYSDAKVDFGGSLPDSDRFDVDTDRHQVVAGVGVRF
ncbi:outer membrane beta-barrel protein [Erythrobacter sp. 3-20A1M]|uniref:outer membrane protein n=1 Tax=Erythrobacter sp. 3-20A1M TaxID=2653850 RepID=UPI001BFC919D|nr:outer membrane beta-barrel protein [Erythrobacter sp. 3-20A1M]QWC55879.1 outer membrane beta-barrel protein [Erythrobacter sp. 3-20A1M]